MVRPTSWTDADSEYLTYLVSSTKLTTVQIANEMDKSTATINIYKKKLGLVNGNPGNKSKYTDNELLDMLRERGACSREQWDSENHPVSSKTFSSRFGGFVNATVLAGIAKKDFTDAEMLDILRKADSTSLNQWQAGPFIPSSTLYKKRFGSWSNALELAGIKNTTGIIQTKTTYVYLVKFTESNIYKVGITQRDVDSRLASFPAFEVLILLEFSTYMDAKQVELSWLSNTKHLSFKMDIPNGFSRDGYSECFRYE